MRRSTQVALILAILVSAGCSPLPGGPQDQTSRVPPTALASPLPLASKPTGVPVQPQPNLRPTIAPAPAALAGETEDAAFFAGLPEGDLYNPSGMAVDLSAGRAYVCGRDGEGGNPVLSVVDLAEMKIAGRVNLQPVGSGVDCRDLAAAGERLYALLSPEQAVYQVSPESGAVRMLNGQADEMVVAPRGERVFLTGAGRLEAIETGSARSLWVVPLESPLQLLRVSADGAQLAAVHPGSPSRLITFNAADGKSQHVVELPDFVTHLAPAPDGGWAVVVGGAPARLIRYSRGLAEIAKAEVPYAAGLLYDATGSRFLLTAHLEDPASPGLGRRVLLALDATTLAPVMEVDQPFTRKGGDYLPAFDVLAFGPTGSVLAMARYGAAALYDLDAETLLPLRRTILGVRLTGLALDEGRSRLFASDDHDRVHVFDLRSGTPVDLWEGGAPIAADARNSRIYANRAEGVVALDSATGSVLAAYAQHGGISPDPARDIVYLVDAGVTYFDRSGELLGRLASTFPTPMGTVPNPFALGATVVGENGLLAVTLHDGVSGSNSGTFLRLYQPMSDNPVAPASAGGSIMDVIAGAGETAAYASYSPTRGMEALVRLDAAGGILGQLSGRTGLLALDVSRNRLYVALDGTLTRLTASSLEIEEVFPFPRNVEQMVPDWAGDRLFVRTAASARIEVVRLEALSPVARSPLPAAPLPPAYVSALDVRPGPGRPAVYALADNLLYRSYDAVAWQRLRPTILQGMSYLIVAADGSLFYASKGGQGAEGVLRSTDAGDSWEVLSQGLSDLRSNQPVVAAGGQRAFFVSRSAGVFAWSPDRALWRQVWAPALPYDPSPQLSLAPDGALYLTSGATTERSTDDGNTWQAVEPLPGAGQIVGFRANASAGSDVFGLSCADGCRLYRASPASASWEPVLSLGGYPFGIRVSAVGDALILLGSDYQEVTVYRSPDGGLTWQRGSHPALAGAFAGHVDANGHLWLGRQGSVDRVPLVDITWDRVP